MSQKKLLINIHKSDLMLFSILKKIFLLISLWETWWRGKVIFAATGNSLVKKQKNNRVHMGQINVMTCIMIAPINKTLECKFHVFSFFQDKHSLRSHYTFPILLICKSKWFQNSNSTAFHKTAICKLNSKALKISLFDFFFFLCWGNVIFGINQYKF